MSDWPGFLSRPGSVAICPWAGSQPIGDIIISSRSVGPTGAAAWPAANRALYVPFVVEAPLTLYKLAILNGAVNGNVDAGVYSYAGSGTTAVRLASIGTTAMAGATALQVFDIADTALGPGNYFLAFVASTITTATFQRGTPSSLLLRASGMAQQALAETKLPETATLARAESSFVPALMGIAREVL